jgi:RNA polymerase sigma-70 factor (ECF subfamily)
VTTLPDIFASPLAQGIATAEAPDARAARREFTALYERHAPRVQRFLRDVLRDEALAWDATQETFARAFGQLAILRDEERARPWLFGVARNVSLELRRARFRAARVVVQDSGEVGRAVAVRVGCPEADLIGREAVAVVDAALERLSEDRRAMLLLRLDHELAYEQIAELMGFSLAKVKVEIFRAREVLRDVMDAYERGTSKRGAR